MTDTSSTSPEAVNTCDTPARGGPSSMRSLRPTGWSMPSRLRRCHGRPPVSRALTHRVAISNHRLLAFDGDHVTFAYKDYAHGDPRRTLTLTAMEFLRRFVQHILPRGFVPIRQSGFLANTCRTARVALARTVLATSAPPAPMSDATESTTTDTTTRTTWACPRCGAAMIVGPMLSALQLATLTWSFGPHELGTASASSTTTT